MFRIEHNAETGEIKEIPLTAEEIDLLGSDNETVGQLPQPTIDEKLASVGLSIDDLKVALGL